MNKCKGCGAPIIWAESDAGTSMPLSINSKEKRFILKPLSAERMVAVTVDTYLSHFADCADANQFRGK